MGNAFLSTHATQVQSFVTSLLDNQKIDDGIRHWVKMIDVKSGKKVVSCARIPLLYSLGGGGGDKSEGRTFLNILLNTSKYCKEFLQVYFQIIQDYFACLNPEMKKSSRIQ